MQRALATRTLLAWLLLGGVLSVWLTAWLPDAARAQTNAFDPHALARARDLAPHTEALEDPSGKLKLRDVVAGPAARRFRPAPAGMSFGFKPTALWLRFQVDNHAHDDSHWVLELDYPLLDYVTLYVVNADGHVEEHRTGDMLPFSTRDMTAANFAFQRETPPNSSSTYYLRVQTSGSLRVPLFAHPAASYPQHQLDQNLMLWMFYGALLVMALFNLGVYVLIRQSEYVVFTLLLAALGLVQFTLAGHTSQYLFKSAPLLANRALPVAIALVIVLIPALGAAAFRPFERFQRHSRIAQRCIAPASVLLLFVCFAPPGVGLRTSVGGAIVLAIVGPLLLIPLLRRRNEQLGLYLRSWYCLVLAVPIHALRSANLIPPIPLTDFAVQIGIAVYGVFTSLALAKRLQVARDQLGKLNAQLSSNVSELKLALIHAEQATEAATQATLAKDQFMATMSHELRTPLNAIINVPQGLLEDFPELAAAECAACGARFLLDEGERVPATARCGDCQASGTLHETISVKYVGAPAHTARFLRKIERSGKHLLQMVNSVLDFSKMQANRLELSRADVDVEALLRETLDELSELAAQRKLSMKLEHSGTPAPLWADPVRIKQVLLNLLSNAIKFSEPESTIRVRWQCDPDADVISVQDQGIGIAPEHQARIFTSFEQVHKGDTRKYGGTGLGLSISRSLVQMHGGEIWVESAEGQGSTFSFSIPRGRWEGREEEERRRAV